MRIAKIIALCSALFCASCAAHDRFTYSGTLQAESANVGSTIGGRVSDVAVSDGQMVKHGQVLVLLDDRELRADLDAATHQEAQAAATVAQAEAMLVKTSTSQPHQLRVARESVRQARAALGAAEAQATQQSLAYHRSQTLFSQGAIAAQALDDARAGYQSSEAAVVGAKATLGSARAQLAQLEISSQPQDLAVAQQSYRAAVASRQAANANVAAAQSRLREMVVRAPADGVVDALDLRPGDMVGPRAQIASVREFINPYVRIYVSQQDLGRVSVGGSVSVRSDALGGRVFDGVVEQIDQDAQFTPQNTQTAEDRANLSYGVKVRVHDPNRELHGGTTVEVAL